MGLGLGASPRFHFTLTLIVASEDTEANITPASAPILTPREIDSSSALAMVSASSVRMVSSTGLRVRMTSAKDRLARSVTGPLEPRLTGL